MIGKTDIVGMGIVGLGASLAACSADTAAPRVGARAVAGLERELAGLTPRETTSCINLRPMQQTKGYGPTIVYIVSPKLKYRSDTGGGCEPLGRGDILVTRTTTSQLCQGDIATTVDAASRFPSGSCSFGPFTRYGAP